MAHLAEDPWGVSKIPERGKRMSENEEFDFTAEKVWFVSSMERLGLDVATIAGIFGIENRSVYRWFSTLPSHCRNHAPEFAVEFMEQQLELQRAYIDGVLDSLEDEGVKPGGEVALPYWVDKDSYKTANPKSPEWYAMIENRSNAILAAMLEAMGHEIKWTLDGVE